MIWGDERHSFLLRQPPAHPQWCNSVTHSFTGGRLCCGGVNKLWLHCPYCKGVKPLEQRTPRRWEQEKAGYEWGVGTWTLTTGLANKDGPCVNMGQGTEVN